MHADLSLGGQRIRGVANPQEGQDGVNLRTLQASIASVTNAVDRVVSDAAREIRTKSLNLGPQ